MFVVFVTCHICTLHTPVHLMLHTVLDCVFWALYSVLQCLVFHCDVLGYFIIVRAYDVSFGVADSCVGPIYHTASSQFSCLPAPFLNLELCVCLYSFLFALVLLFHRLSKRIKHCSIHICILYTIIIQCILPSK